MGYLAATHRIGQLKGNQSYQAKFNRTIVSLIENKRENSNRNWSIQVENVGFRESKGLVTMMSGIVDTVNDNMTEYGIIFNGLSYSLKKPWMAWNGKSEAILFDSKGREIAKFASSYIKKPLFNKIITIWHSEQYTDEEIAFFIAVLNTAVFI